MVKAIEARFPGTTGLGGVGVYLEHLNSTNPADMDRIKLRWGSPGPYQPILGYQSVSNPRYPIRWGAEDSALASLGLHWRSAVTQANGTYRRRFTAAIPFWALFAASAAFAMWTYIAGVLRRQREDREALGLCPRCGVPLKSEFTKCPGCDRPVQLAHQGQVG